MRIDRIKLNNYKRFGAFEVPLDPQFNLFVGDNASGKTTILDAITVCLDSWFIGMKGVQGIGSIDQEEVHVVAYPHGDVVSFEKQFPARVECQRNWFALTDHVISFGSDGSEILCAYGCGAAMIARQFTAP